MRKYLTEWKKYANNWLSLYLYIAQLTKNNEKNRFINNSKRNKVKNLK